MRDLIVHETFVLSSMPGVSLFVRIPPGEAARTALMERDRFLDRAPE